MKKLWGGRFKKKTDPLVEEFTSSISFDKRLARYDALCSIAHAKMLGKCGIVAKGDAARLVSGLSVILKEIEAEKFAYDDRAEDIHTSIQNVLRKKVGGVADRLHAARSRNDLAVTDLRMYCKDGIDEILALVLKLQKALLGFASKNRDVIIPGYTHLQRAQSVLLAHYAMAYVEMLQRDKERLADAKKRTDVMPLGSAALAGTSLPVDRKFLAKELGFAAISGNTMDAVSDRDFVVEILAAISVLAMHLSRFAEDLIVWSSQEFAFIDIGEAYATGSSIMPHKKNPDVLELVRGNAGALYGNLLSVLTMMKALPLTYNRDMQLDKKPLFDSFDTIKPQLEILGRLVANTAVNRKMLEVATSDELLCATDIAEHLVKKGMPFAKAHQATGRIVRYSLDAKKKIADMSLDEIKSVCSDFDEGIYKVLSAKKSVCLKSSFGGTSPAGAKRALTAWKRRLG